jgi:hypothetical protein
MATEQVRTTERGALTKPRLGSVMFELVHSDLGAAPAKR